MAHAAGSAGGAGGATGYRGPWLNGSVSGHVRERPDSCVLWVDAHADVNVPLTTPTGNLHGQPVAFLLRELHDKRSVPALPGFSWLSPCLLAKDIAYIGLRDVDPAESFILKSGGMRHFSMRDVDLLVIQKVVEMALDHLMPRCRRPLHLSFDMDALDPSVAPAATGTPVRGGAHAQGGVFIAEEVHATGSLSALDLVEVNPRVTGGEGGDAVVATVDLGVEVVLSCLGRARGRGSLVRTARTRPGNLRLFGCRFAEGVPSPSHPSRAPGGRCEWRRVGGSRWVSAASPPGHRTERQPPGAVFSCFANNQLAQ
ncbi:LOW QUALITY PROTEIN: arginase-2, mitochondrial-like [Lampetra fluviatilis]